MSQLKKFRHEKDQFFVTHPHSPLTHQQIDNFQGLDYFPENPDLRFEVDIEKPADEQEIVIQTSTGDFQTYYRFGKFEFEVEGQYAELTLYANENGLFMPFVDSLAGEETYPAGRYLEPELLSNGKYMVDFNLAYNPYCAYNEQWNCPLTPFENRLKVPIKAGERIFQDHQVHV